MEQKKGPKSLTASQFISKFRKLLDSVEFDTVMIFGDASDMSSGYIVSNVDPDEIQQLLRYGLQGWGGEEKQKPTVH